MTCRRAFEADLAAVLHGDGDAAFLAHAETCAECAAEVRVWRELDELLHAGAAAPAPASHPEPAALLAFVDAPGSLAPDLRAAVERHVAACPACTDEARALRGFDATALAPAPGAAREVGVAGTPAARPAAKPPATGAPSARGWVGRVLWHPAFAYALVALLAVPLVRELVPKLGALRMTEETRAVDARRAPPALHDRVQAPGAPPASREERRAPSAPVVAEPLAKAAPPVPAAAPPVAEVPPPAAELDVPLGIAADAAAGARARVVIERAPRVEGSAPAARHADEEEDFARGSQASKEPPMLADAARVGAPALRTAPSGDGAPLVLELEPQKPTLYGAEVVGRPVTLRVGRPADLGSGSIAVTVRRRADRREITAWAGSADAIALDMPAGWLTPGDYVVTLQPAAGGAPVLLGFTVRAPTAR